MELAASENNTAHADNLIFMERDSPHARLPVDAPYLRGTKQAYLLRVTISMQNGDIFAKAVQRQYLWYACPKKL